MKFKRADTDTLFEALENGSCVRGHKCNFFGSYIGSVEIVVAPDIEGGYITELYLAIQLPTGEILGVGDNNKAVSLHGNNYTILWGVYPADFPEEKKTKRPCPKNLKPRFDILVDCFGIQEVSISDLPF